MVRGAVNSDRPVEVSEVGKSGRPESMAGACNSVRL